jgi:D-alanyl-D-alanine carboxypeptidase
MLALLKLNLIIIIAELGQTGFAPGFISMCFYFPETKTSLIALDNVVWESQELQKAFLYH